MIHITYKLLLTACLLCGFCHVAVFAYAYDRNAQSASAQALASQTAASGIWQQSSGSSQQSVTVLGDESYPAFNFQTTSPYGSTVGNTSGGMTMQKGPRRSSPWDPPTDNPIGTVDNQTPIDSSGSDSALILLVAALMYVLCRTHKRRVKAVRA
ncbi:MAG: hypothetical protein J6T76_03540 [Paludibacteraceae bacterium]|nr:hypothetical protein [Paludibacteraceae bacterium]